jgi:hypothetical protein
MGGSGKRRNAHKVIFGSLEGKRTHSMRRHRGEHIKFFLRKYVVRMHIGLMWLIMAPNDWIL